MMARKDEQMAIRQTPTPTVDLLTMPPDARARIGRLDAGREAGIEARRRAAQERHEGRVRARRGRLIDGATDLTGYRQGLAESDARLAADLADTPPVIDEDLLRERVYVRALESIATWWAAEIETAARQQQTWAPATADVTEEVLYATA